MSNLISQMLSMIFFAFLIIFSGEAICYQTSCAKAMSETEQIAIHVQEYGNDDVYNYCSQSKLSINIDSCYIIHSTNYDYCNITTSKDYKPFSNMFNGFKGKIKCKICVVKRR